MFVARLSGCRSHFKIIHVNICLSTIMSWVNSHVSPTFSECSSPVNWSHDVHILCVNLSAQQSFKQPEATLLSACVHTYIDVSFSFRYLSPDAVQLTMCEFAESLTRSNLQETVWSDSVSTFSGASSPHAQNLLSRNAGNLYRLPHAQLLWKVRLGRRLLLKLDCIFGEVHCWCRCQLWE